MENCSRACEKKTDGPYNHAGFRRLTSCSSLIFFCPDMSPSKCVFGTKFMSVVCTSKVKEHAVGYLSYESAWSQQHGRQVCTRATYMKLDASLGSHHSCSLRSTGSTSSNCCHTWYNTFKTPTTTIASTKQCHVKMLAVDRFLLKLSKI